MKNLTQKLKLTFFFIFIYITLLLNAKNGDSIQIGSPKKNSSYFELFGNGSIYSINFERLFFSKPSWQLRGHIGYCLWNYYEADRFVSFKNIFPMEISFIKGKNEHHLECGAGYTFIFNVNDTFVGSNQFTYFKREIWTGSNSNRNPWINFIHALR